MAGMLTKSSFRYLLRHPWQFGLSILGIALGVTIIFSIDIANYSTSKAFNISLNSVTGKATHRITGISSGIPDSVYYNLRVEKGVKNIAPVIEGYIALDDTVKRVFRMLGVDVFAEKPFRDYLAGSESDPEFQLKDFLTQTGTIVLSEETAKSLNKSQFDTINFLVNGKKRQLVISGLIKNYSNKPALENLILTDIASAQIIMGKEGVIDFIDIIANTDEEIARVKSFLPEGFSFRKSASRSDTAEQMLDAFNVNLTALSLLALIVGIFLIYNSMTFSVVQRKTLLGTLRSLGVTRTEIYRLIIKEVLLIGIAGTALGFLFGFIISKTLIALISRTINDLYFVVSVQDIQISPFIIIKGILVGIGASVLSALKPAKEASEIQPRIAMIRSEQESGILTKIPKLTFWGITIGLLGCATLLIPSKSVWLSYFGILPVIIGFALMTPFVIVVSDKIFSPLMKKLFGITGSIASRGIIQNISRTNAAIAALGIAVAATVGVGTMINSFRETVVKWLDTSLRADLYISTPALVSNKNDASLPDYILDEILKLDKVKAVNYYRELEIIQDGKKYDVLASGISDFRRDGFQLKEGNPEEVWKKFTEGDVIVTEPFAYKNDLKKGSVINLKTDKGFHEFKVAGVYYDYSSEQGYVSVDYSVFKKFWNAKGISGMSVYAKTQEDIPEVTVAIQRIARDNLQLFIRTNKYLRESSIEIFDRTFIVAKVLQLLAVIVAFIGLLSSLMSLQLERSRELGVLRANGLLPSQLFKIVTIQSTMIGIISGVIAIPLGNLLAAILVYIINKRSFGWTMQFDIVPSIALEALFLAVFAAVIAGIYPGYKMSKTSPSRALRGE